MGMSHQTTFLHNKHGDQPSQRPIPLLILTIVYFIIWITNTNKSLDKHSQVQMAARELIVVVLNHTNEELNLEPESLRLEHGEWMDAPDSQSPQEIRAGESGMWRCKSRHIGTGIEGSVTYRIVGYGTNDRVTLTWNVHYVGPNKFHHSCATEEFTVRVLGGAGKQAVAVFVFGKSSALVKDDLVLKKASPVPNRTSEGLPM